METVVMVTRILTTKTEAVKELIHRAEGSGADYVHNPDGSPRLIGSDRQISVSHSRHWAAIALHPHRRIGVDIEEHRIDQLTRVSGKFLNASELAAGWDKRLVEAWTGKEATYKAAGVPGLALADIDLSAAEGFAEIPDGRRFTLRREITSDYVLTTATPFSH